MTEQGILVLGASGQLGRALVSRLAPFGRVIDWDRMRLDLERSAEIVPALEGLRPAIIVNAAAFTAVDRAEQERTRAFAVNAEAPGEIARWAKSQGALLLHYSTDYVFDGAGETPWTEESPTAPLNAYGASKLAGEQAIVASGCEHLIVRTSWLYAGAGKNFLTTMLNLMRDRETISVVADQFGAPCPVDFLAEASAALLAGDRRGIVNVTTAGETSWHSFAVAIREEAEQLGLTLRVREILPIPASAWPAQAQRPANSRLDLAKLRDYGVTPPDWRDALRAVMSASIKSGAFASRL